MAPLGILTGVVSAIRVCGGPSLRAFIGRAQEGGGIAEAELCSSTSRDVCELYHNGAIVRVFGRPKILEVVYDPTLETTGTSDKSSHAGIFASREYFQECKGCWREIGRKEAQPEAPLEKTTDSFAPNPNLSLNIGIKRLPIYIDWAAAASGLLL
ncbi:hypothetical protein GGR54DRAFT_639535 [Hypoxylon sp. NC1633]|nr:hypothetical protein GGR54DRAFT_639535 [Hypoxylon sp. NC1633]